MPPETTRDTAARRTVGGYPATGKPVSELQMAKRKAVDVRGDASSSGVWLFCNECKTSIPVHRRLSVDFVVRWADAHLCEVAE